MTIAKKKCQVDFFDSDKQHMCVNAEANRTLKVLHQPYS